MEFFTCNPGLGGDKPSFGQKGTDKKLHNRLWNGGNGRGTVKLYRKQGRSYVLLDEVIAENVGCEYGEYDPIS